MSDPSILALISALTVSAVSLVGIVLLPMGEDAMRRAAASLVAFAAGALLGTASLHLMPEAFALAASPRQPLLVAAVGAGAFLLLDALLRLKLRGGAIRPVGYINLVADAVHNLVDGVAIAAAWLTSPGVGLATTLAVLAHEIPAELGEFGVLIHAGFRRRTALLLNLVSALTAVIGVLGVLLLGGQVADLQRWALPFAAGGFVYLSLVHLLPQVLARRQALGFALLALGFGVMAASRAL